MKRISTWLAVAILALGSRMLMAQAPSPAPTPAGGAVSTPSPSPVPTLVDDIIKLWKANLSEDFLKKYVSTSDAVKELTVEDIVRLRNAGLPENLILVVTQKQQKLRATPAAAPAGPGAAAPAPPAAPVTLASTPVPSPGTIARWAGLARRNGGIVLFKNRWDPGILEFKDGTLSWVDSKDVSKNLLIPLKSLMEQQLTCPKKAGGECFEWVARTRSDEFRFRNVGWKENENAGIEDIFSFLKVVDPNLVSSKMPVDEK